jgi:hypothetical protein
MLVPVVDGLWTAHGPIRFAGVNMPLEMAVLRLDDGALLLYGPAHLDEHRREIDALGEVRFLVAPNHIHHLYVPRARELWPDARVFGAPGLEKKRGDIRFDGLLGGGSPFGYGVDVIEVAGMPGLREHVLYAKASRALVVADTMFNVQHLGGLSRVLWSFNGGCGAMQSRVFRWLVKDKAAFRASLDEIRARPFEAMHVSHGAPIVTGAREVFERVTSWSRP